MANLMRPGMYNAYHHITIIPNSEQVAGLPDREQDALTSVPLVALEQEMPDNGKDLITKTGIYDVVGGLCENNDKFAVDRALNVEPRPGDVAVIHDSGAHGHSMGFNYNGKPRSAERRTQSRVESSRVKAEVSLPLGWLRAAHPPCRDAGGARSEDAFSLQHRGETGAGQCHEVDPKVELSRRLRS